MDYLERKKVELDFARFISAPKVKFFKRFGLDIIMADRAGVYFYDASGKKYFNCHSNGGVFNLGHRNPEIIQALKQALDEADIGNHHFISSHRSRLARMLIKSCGHFSKLDKVTFGVSGGEAADLAIKLARGYTGRRSVVSVAGGYHGHTGLALAAGDARYREAFHSSSPDFVQIPWGDARALERLVPRPAALILETAPATAGMLVPQKSYLQDLRRLTRKLGVVLILDEVQTGLGRCGKSWGFQHFGIEPDIFITGKGLSGGIYPITATIYQKRFEKIFAKDPFLHISTYGGAEVGCAVASRVLELSFAKGFLADVEEKGAYLERELNRLKSIHPQVKEIRRLGLFMGVVFQDEVSCLVYIKALLAEGVFAVYANNDRRVLQFLPPLVLSMAEARELINKCAQALEKMERLKYRMLKSILKLVL